MTNRGFKILISNCITYGLFCEVKTSVDTIGDVPVDTTSNDLLVVKGYLRHVLNKCKTVGDVELLLPDVIEHFWLYMWEDIHLSDVTVTKQPPTPYEEECIALIKQRLALNLLHQ